MMRLSRPRHHAAYNFHGGAENPRLRCDGRNRRPKPIVDESPPRACPSAGWWAGVYAGGGRPPQIVNAIEREGPGLVLVTCADQAHAMAPA